MSLRIANPLFQSKYFSTRFSSLLIALLTSLMGFTSCGGSPAGNAPTSGTAVQLKILTSTLGAAVVGQSYQGQLAASGGELPYEWSISAGQFPPGLAIDSASGNIFGQPILPGSYTFTTQVRDSEPQQNQVATQSLTMTVGTAPLAITTPSLPPGIVGVPYSLLMQATGGTPPYMWSIASGALPPGLEFDALTGEITGYPQSSGTFSVTFQVTDSSTPALVAKISFAAAGRGPG